MKYKMTLGGRGAELYIHQLTEEQKQQLQDMKIEDRDAPVDWDKLNEILKTEWDYTDDMYTGAYDNPTAYHIRVFDENDEEVFSSDDDFFLEEGESEEDYQFVEKENVLVIEHYMKGTFKDYELEIEGEFDPSKITPVVVEINEAISLITDLKYDNKEIENFEYGDDWSKGAFFHIF
jgi:hypothetical protein